MSVFIEHTAGWFPFWCAPEQVRILTIGDSEEVRDYVGQVREVLGGVVLEDPIEHNRLRYSVDDSADSLSKKIKRAVGLKIPAVLVVGAKDAESKVVSARLRDSEEKVKLNKLAEFLEKM